MKRKLFNFVMIITLFLVIFAMDVKNKVKAEIDQTKISIEDIYSLLHEHNDSIASSETFKFKILPVKVTKSTATIVPSFSESSYNIAFTNKGRKSKDINLPNYDKVGIYEYKITQIEGNTLGIDYSNKELKLEVYVFNNSLGTGFIRTYIIKNLDGDKINQFENKYKAGKLTIKNNVTGLLGDTEKLFNIKVKFKNTTGKEVKSDIHYGTNKKIIAADLSDGEEIVTIKLKDKQTEVFSNIPYGITYEIIEDDYSSEGYNTTYSNQNNTINQEESNAEVTNSKAGTVPTGLIYDITKYVIVSIIIIILLAIILIRYKRKNA